MASSDSLLVALALIPGCSMPRAGVAAGVVTAIAGAALVNDASNIEPQDSGFGPSYALLAEAEVVLGGALLAGAAALLIGSIASLSQAPAEPPPQPLPVVVAPSTPRPGSARAALRGRVAQLAFELRVEASAGHCATASALALRIDRLDRAALIALIATDDAIAACVDLPPIEP